MLEGSRQENASSDTPILYVSVDRLRVLIDWPAGHDDLTELLAAVPQQWESLKITVPLNLESVRERLQEARQAGVYKQIPLAEGEAPTSPVHGFIAWAGPYFESGFQLDESTGAVNYRRRAARSTVAAQEQLAALIPPVDGIPGMDVYGKPIAAPPGRRAVLESGENVYTSPTGDVFYAAIEGHIRQIGNRLRVDETYVLSGIGLKSGDIDHPGALEVQGDVEPGSHVRAKGNIHITGLVQDSTIECGGDLTVVGGITGGEGRYVRAAGNLHARYLAHLSVDVGGDVTVEREIDQCEIRCQGGVYVPEGRIVGGEVIALGGMFVSEAGSHGAVATHLVAGLEEHHPERLRHRHEGLEALHRAIEHLRTSLAQLLPHAARLDAHQREQLVHLQDKLAELVQQQETSRVELRRIEEAMQSTAHARIDVNKMLHSEVHVCIAGYPLHIQEPVHGPIHLVVSNGELGIQSGTRTSSH